MLDPKTIQHTDFETLLHQEFRLVDGGNAVPLELVQVRATRAASQNEFRQPFALEFKAPSAVPLRQGIYPVSHEKTGTLELFMVPVQADETGTYFYVTIN